MELHHPVPEKNQSNYINMAFFAVELKWHISSLQNQQIFSAFF